MSLKFAANLSTLFQEGKSICERYALAERAGFKAVECAYPYNEQLDDLVAAKTASGLTHTLINNYPGDLNAGERGFAALPGKEQEFKESLELSIRYGKMLNCAKIHIMSGCKPHQNSATKLEVYRETYIKNLLFAADRLQKEGILALIEPVNSFITTPNYIMDSPRVVWETVRELNHPNLKFQLDVYHLQLTEGNLTRNIKKYLPLTGYIQIAQAPDRNEPDSPGEINYKYILDLLSELGYKDYIGLEYFPAAGNTTESLQWMNHMGFSL